MAICGCPMARRVREAWLLALVLALLLGGCARATPTPEPVTIRFAVLQDDAKYYGDLANVYAKTHPNVTIQIVARSPDILEQLKPADADVIFTGSAARRQQQGDLLSLDPWLTQEEFAVGDFVPGAVDLFASEGKTWAIPAWVDPLVMFYNRDLFDQYGVEHPRAGWTWDDFLATALTLRQADPTVYGYGFAIQSADPLTFVYLHGGKIVDDLQKPTRATLDDPLTIEAVDRFAQLVLEYDVAPSPEQATRLFGGDDSYAAYRGVFGGKVGMWIGNYSSQGGRGWPVKWPFKWGIATIPRDAYTASYASVGALAISSQAKNPEACWEWLSFLSQQLPSQYAPARKSLLESAGYTQLVGDENAAVIRETMKNVQLLNSDLSGLERIFEVFTRALEQVIDGQASAAEAMSQAQREAEKLVP